MPRLIDLLADAIRACQLNGYRASARMKAEMQADEFRRAMSEAKAPTTWRLKRAVDDVLYEPGLLPLGAQRDELERVATALAWSAERGAEESAASAAYVDSLVAGVREK